MLFLIIMLFITLMPLRHAMPLIIAIT